jgi:hypothetical protein
MKQKPDYILPLPFDMNVKEVRQFLKKPLPVQIPAAPQNKNQIGLLFTKSLLNDLYSKGYKLTLAKKRKSQHHHINVSYPDYSKLSNLEKKNFVQKGHQLERDNQLFQKSNYVFIKKMETMKLYKGKWISIFDLMADGNIVVEKIIKYRTTKTWQDTKRLSDYSKIIDPYIQFVSSGKKCSLTGLQLNDIWRYFRHTWSLEYKSLPGRSIRILIRDKSIKHHPVIGIAALGSSVAQQTMRDEMLGWSQNNLKGLIEVEKKWYQRIKKRLLDSVKYSDLIDKNFKVVPKNSDDSVVVRIEKKEILHPTGGTIKKLEQISFHFMNLHYAGKNKSYKPSEDTVHSHEYWDEQSSLPLFVAKRSRALGIILGIDSNVIQSSIEKDTLEIPAKFYKSLLRLIKAEKVGIDLMDIIICGAVAPYNQLLGGKLVAMLLASPEVTKYVRKKYLKMPSIIASSIKGKPFYRKPNLVFLGTTSLYGRGLSQYTRIAIPSSLFRKEKKSDFDVRYKSLGESLGFGTYHISNNTRKLARLYNERKNPEDDVRAPRVNYIFGEGVNPLFRMLSQTISNLGYPANNVLRHQSLRNVYAATLIKNIENYLLGKDSNPEYIIPQDSPKKRSTQIIQYWAERWLSNRLKREDVLKKIKTHTLDHPVTHGAKVPLPKREYGPLFE